MIRGDRIRERLELLGRSQGWLAREVGLSSQAISKMVNGGTEDSPKLFQIARALRTTPEYLTGESDDPSLQAVVEHRTTYRARPRLSDNDSDIVEIAEIELNFGLGEVVMDELPEPKMRSFSRAWLRQITTSAPDQLYWARGKGNSMEPTIGDGDIILIDRSQQTLDYADLYWAIAYGHVGMVKRLRPMPDGSVKILSDHASVPPEVAVDGELNIFGRVIAVVKKI